jgi:hypothetical protein
MPILVPGSHITLCYGCRFRSYEEMHKFRIQSKILLTATPIELVLRSYGLATYRVDPGCEAYALCRLVQDLLPDGAPVDHELHLSWPSRSASAFS